MQALEYACLPLFEEITRLTGTPNADRDQILQTLKVRLDESQARARKLGCPEEDVQDATYALVALVDERIPNDHPHLRPLWRNALQQLCYGENTAGEGFFIRLNELLSVARRQQAVRIYALALAFGFQGVYQNSPNMPALRKGVRRYLGLPSKTLPMNPAIASAPARRRNASDNPALIWSAAAVLCAGIVAIALVRNKLNQETRTIIQKLPDTSVIDPSL